jgi:hypothetical protein
MERLEKLSAKKALNDSEMAEMEALESSATAPTPQRTAAELNASLPPDDAGNAALRGFGKGASLGFVDELSGVFRAAQGLGPRLAKALLTTDVGRNIFRQAVPAAQEMSNAELDAIATKAIGETNLDLGVKGDVLADYRTGRDEARGEEAKLAKSNPKMFRGTEFAGNLAAAAAFPGPGPKIPGAGAVFRGAQFAKSAVPFGAAAGLGDSEADLTRGEARQAIDDLIAGGQMAGATAGVAGPAIEGIGGGLRSLARNRATAAMKPNSGDVARLERTGLRDALPEDLLESGVMRPFQTTEGLAENVGEELTKRGAAQGAVVEGIDRATRGQTVLPDVVAERVEQEAVAPLRKQAATASRGLADKAQREADIIREMYGTPKGAARPSEVGKPISLADAEEFIKRAHSDAADRFYSGRDTEAAEAAKNVYSAVRRANEDAAEAAAGSLAPELAGRFAPAKQATGRMAEAARILAKSNPRLAANKFVGAGEAEFGQSAADAILPGGAGPQGFANTALGQALGLVAGFLGRRANTTAAVGARTAGKALEEGSPELAKAATIAALRKYLGMEEPESP